jgi:hypothetical protein
MLSRLQTKLLFPQITYGFDKFKNLNGVSRTDEQRSKVVRGQHLGDQNDKVFEYLADDRKLQQSSEFLVGLCDIKNIS